MVIDVRPILHTPGKRLDFRFELDLSGLEFDGRRPVSRPVAVEGEIRNTADLLELELTARTTLDAVCDRCGKEFSLEKEISYGWRMGKWTRASWPGRPSSSVWTAKPCVRKIAKDCVPGAAPI